MWTVWASRNALVGEHVGCLSCAVGESSQDQTPSRPRAVFLRGNATDDEIQRMYEAITSDEPNPDRVEFEPGTPPPAKAPRGTIYDLAKGRAYYPPDYAGLYDNEPPPSDVDQV